MKRLLEPWAVLAYPKRQKLLLAQLSVPFHPPPCFDWLFLQSHWTSSTFSWLQSPESNVGLSAEQTGHSTWVYTQGPKQGAGPTSSKTIVFDKASVLYVFRSTLIIYSLYLGLTVLLCWWKQRQNSLVCSQTANQDLDLKSLYSGLPTTRRHSSPTLVKPWTSGLSQSTLRLVLNKLSISHAPPYSSSFPRQCFKEYVDNEKS